MKTSTLLKSFSSKLSGRCSSSVAVSPWPPVRTAFDSWLTSELDDLGHHHNLYTTASWLSKSLQVAISAQQKATDSVQNATDSKIFDGYLDDTVDLLDACNVVRRRIEDIKTYLNSVSIALRWLERGHGHSAVQRARAKLESCTATEKRCTEMDTCGSTLRKLGERISMQGTNSNQSESELQEVLAGSRSLALLVIAMANISLSFRSRRSIPNVQSSKNHSNWGDLVSEMQKEAKEEFEKRRKDGIVMEELRGVVLMTQRLRRLLGEGERREEVMSLVRELKKSCEELEEGIKSLEEGVDGLYMGLIDVRICMLRVISDV